MDTMLYILIGFIIGTFLSNYVGFNKVVKAIEELKGLPQQKKDDEPVQPKKLKGTGRKGLMEKSFTDQTTKESIDVEFEIYEIEAQNIIVFDNIVEVEHVEKALNNVEEIENYVMDAFSKVKPLNKHVFTDDEISEMEILDDYYKQTKNFFANKRKISF
jgi:translation elongation factor EF-1beta